jgi:putative DNA primase/helicase
MPDLTRHIGDIARRLLGEPNKALSTRSQLRFGNYGSTAVEITGKRAGEWYDHEEKVGGGPSEFLRLKGGLVDEDIPAWLECELGIPQAKAANGQDRSSALRIIAAYDYSDEHGELLFQVCRLHPKTFRQRRPDRKGGWVWDTKGVRRVPYHLRVLVAAAAEANGKPWRVYIVEGEKDADRLRTDWGLTATTNPGGAGKWRGQYNRYFAGADVVIIPDNDESGREHARDVAANLAPVAASVHVLDLQGVPKKGDISDWIADGGSQSDLETLVEITPPFQPDGVSSAEIRLPLNSGATRVARKIEWLWKGWLPVGKFVILAGLKTAGKSTLGITTLATITRGGEWPDGSRAPLGDVLVWSGEDDFDDTILPRFLAAGGDPVRLFPIEYVIAAGEKRAFDPSRDITALRAAAKQLLDLKMVVIDPVVMAIPTGSDSHKNAETRRGLQPLIDFVAETRIMGLGITHFTKGTADRDPIERVTGSLAFTAVPRVVLAAVSDQEGKQRRLVRVASNIGPSGGGIEYLLTQEPLDGYDFSAQRVRWGGILQGPARDLVEMKGQTELLKACQFLLDQLANGPVPVKELQAAAQAHGVGTWRTVERAKTKPGNITASKVGTKWVWGRIKPDVRDRADLA